MTAKADQIRRARRIAAAPDSRHDHIVRAAAVGLPGVVGAILAAMLVLPLFPKNEVSFLLDRTRVAITEDRLAVNGASYRGQDDKGRPFTVNAGSAVQHSASVPVVEMRALTAHMQLSDGKAEAVAPTGAYHIDTDHLVLSGPVKMTTTTGYALQTSTLALDLKARRAFGDGGVTGQLTTGPFSADRISADLEARTVSLDGHVHLTMTPGRRLKAP